MEKLYLDNYRGFTGQCIEIRDVNFLVGENSSGKSSVLLALNTVFSQNFWINLDFGAADSITYSFEDLVSAESGDKSYFRLGYIYDNPDETSFIFEFINESGKPVVSKAALSNKNNSVYLYTWKNVKEIGFHAVKGSGLSIEFFSSFSEEKITDRRPVNITPPLNTPASLLMFSNMIAGDETISWGHLPLQAISFTAPIRSKPRKTYDEPATPVSSEGGHIPYILRRLFRENETKLKKSLNEFGRQSGLFNNIVIKEYSDDSDDAPFRMNFVLNNEPINIVNVGYGVSQILPVLFDALTKNKTMLEIQQPEVHLHPKAQAALGDVFFELAIENSGKRFLVETHSDYIIDRFRQKQKKSRQKSCAHVLFFLRRDGKNHAYSITIDEKGNYDTDQPEEFREFFITEAIENLGL